MQVTWFWFLKGETTEFLQEEGASGHIVYIDVTIEEVYVSQ